MRPASCALRTRTSKRRRGVRGDRAPHERTKPHRTSGRPPAVPYRTSGRPPAVPYRTSGRPPTVKAGLTAPAPMETVIGLEVHAQLLTRSKMFCGCPTTFGAPPNSQTCPVCQGMPGVLPVVNRRAVELGIRAALAFECRVNAACRFARKHYYYPDMPKNYQITQYEEPLAEDGRLEIDVDGASRTIGIQRLHLEEDVGKLLHEGTLETAQASLVDYNRSGVPLMETVSKPDLRSPEEASAYLKAFRAVLVYLGVSSGNMEEGSLRCDANVSLRPRGARELGTKVEIKNMNSFRNVQRALEFEVRRQAQALGAGERIVQETRLWDADGGYTRSMRSKEYAHDYRYFPEPDLVPLTLDRARVAEIRAGLRELPADDERAIESSPITPGRLAGLLKLVEAGTISGKIAKDVLQKMFVSGEDARVIVSREGLTQVADEAALGAVIDRVIAQNPKAIEDYRRGKTVAAKALVGQVMKATGGKANPGIVNRLLEEKLSQT